MFRWVSIDDRYPRTEDEELNKYKVRILKGSMQPQLIEKVVLGGMRATGFRFLVGDWQTVTHWQEHYEE